MHDPQWLASSATGSTSFMAGTPDGRYLAYQTTDSTLVSPSAPLVSAALVVRDTLTGTVEVEWTAPLNDTSATTILSADLSDDGRFMTLVTGSQLDPQRPTNAMAHLYVLDRWTDTATLVTRRADRTAGSISGPHTPSQVQIDASGRYVLFSSGALDLIGPGTGYGWTQLYRWDRLTDDIVLVSGAPGVTPNGFVLGTPRLSADGQTVVFNTTSTNLISTGPGAGNNGSYVADLSAGTLTPFITAGGQHFSATDALLSADGSRVVFTGAAESGVFGGPSGQVYLLDTSTMEVTLVSRSATSATTGANGVSELAGFSADGSVVAFTSAATNAIAGQVDANWGHDVFVRDLDTGTTRLLSRSAGSATATASDGVARDVRLSNDGTYATWHSEAHDTPAGPPTAAQIPVFAAEVATGTMRRLNRDTTPLWSVPIFDPVLIADGGRIGVVGSSYGPILSQIAPDPLAPASRFVALAPSRLLDTRDGTGDERTKLGIGLDRPEEIYLQVTGRGGVPVRDVGSVVLNVTSVDAPASGFISVRPARAQLEGVPFCMTPVLHSCSRPVGALTTSNLNVDRPGRVIANHVTVPVGPGGRVALASTAGGHLVVDVLGYYSPTDSTRAGRLVGQSPARILDTREGLGATAPLVAGGSLRLQVTGRGGVPLTGAGAVVLNVTVPGAANPGFVTVWPSGSQRPLASNLNVESRGQVRPNLVTVPLGTGGAVDLFASSGGHLVADVLGWYTNDAAAPSSSGRFVPIDPARFLDTRTPELGGPSKPGAGQTINRSATSAGIPLDAAAVIANVTATEANGAGFVTAFPAGTAVPLASNLNLEFAGQTVPNQALLRPGSGGSIAFFSSGGTHLIADAAGWWTN